MNTPRPKAANILSQLRQTVNRTREIQSALEETKEVVQREKSPIEINGNSTKKQHTAKVKTNKEETGRNNSSNGLRKAPAEVTRLLQRQMPNLRQQKSTERMKNKSIDKRQVILQKSNSIDKRQAQLQKSNSIDKRHGMLQKSNSMKNS